MTNLKLGAKVLDFRNYMWHLNYSYILVPEFRHDLCGWFRWFNLKYLEVGLAAANTAVRQLASLPVFSQFSFLIELCLYDVTNMRGRRDMDILPVLVNLCSSGSG